MKSSVTLGALMIDLREQQAYLHDEPLQLTTYEYKLLHYLMTSAGQTYPKGDLADYLYDIDGDRDSNVIEVFVGRLVRNCSQPRASPPLKRCVVGGIACI